jgi:hypothetical protein
MEFDKYERLYKAHHKELLHQAEQSRLVQQALLGTPKKTNLTNRFLCWLKQRLINASGLLRETCSGKAPAPSKPSSQCPCGECA